MNMEEREKSTPRSMEWTRDKTLELLREYEQRRVLWDWNAKGYRDRVKRKRAIHDLAEKLGCNILEVEKKITNLKCQYSREVHKIQISKESADGTDHVYISKWFAFKAMQFLQFGSRTYSARKKQHQKIDDSLVKEEYIVSDIDPESISFMQYEESNDEDETNGSATGSFNNASLSGYHEEESLSSSLMTMDERYRKENLLNGQQNNPKEKDEDTKIHHESRRTVVKNDLIKFGESIALQLAEIPDSYSRSVAKLKINQILFEAEIGVYAQTHI